MHQTYRFFLCRFFLILQQIFGHWTNSGSLWIFVCSDFNLLNFGFLFILIVENNFKYKQSNRSNGKNIPYRKHTEFEFIKLKNSYKRITFTKFVIFLLFFFLLGMVWSFLHFISFQLSRNCDIHGGINCIWRCMLDEKKRIGTEKYFFHLIHRKINRHLIFFFFLRNWY